MKYDITADSTPVYGRFWDYWSAEDWIYWHTLNEQKAGLDAANRKLIEAWNDSPFLAQNINFRSFNSNFISYAKEKGFYSALFGGIFGILGKGTSTTSQALDTGVNVVQNGLSALSKVADSVNATSIIIIPLLLGLGIFYVYKKYMKG